MRRYICEIDALLNDIRFFSFPIVKFLPTGWMDGWISSYPSFPLILQINSLLGRRTGYLFGQWNIDGYHFEEIIGIIFIPLCNCELIRWN